MTNKVLIPIWDGDMLMIIGKACPTCKQLYDKAEETCIWCLAAEEAAKEEEL